MDLVNLANTYMFGGEKLLIGAAVLIGSLPLTYTALRLLARRNFKYDSGELEKEVTEISYDVGEE